jgi:hypothetical protein
MKAWKKWTAVTMITCTLALPGLANADDMMKQTYNYSGVPTVMKDGMELAPLRQVAEFLGFKVTWNDMDRSIVLTKMPMMDNKMMDMSSAITTIKIDSKTAMKGSMEAMLSYAPIIVNDMTYVNKEFVDMYLLK